MEIWREVKGFEDYYEASNFGRIKSLGKFTKNGSWYSRDLILKHRISSESDTGSVILTLDGVRYAYQVNRLIYDTFKGFDIHDSSLNIVNIDGDKKNCHIDNLSLITVSKKVLKVVDDGNHNAKGKFGKLSVTSRVIVQYSLEGEFIKRWGSIIDAHRTLGISYNSIIGVCIGRKYCHTAGGFKWKYK